jgi:ABC-type spermidine/putrescine transport system permease subunit II
MLRRNRTSLNRIADRRIILTTVGFCVAAGVLPLVVAVILSFCSVDPKGSFHFGSLEGYRALLGGGRIEEFRKVLFRAVIVTIMTMLISVPTAYWVARIRRAGIQTITLALIVTPWFVSDMLRAFGWQLLLSPSGPVSAAWIFVTSLGPPEGLRYNFSAVVVGLMSSMLPAAVLSVLAAVPNTHRTEWLAAAEFGRSRHVFSLMALGRARPGILLGACVVFVLSCFASSEARFLDGPTQTSVQTVAASLVNDGVPALLAFGTVLVTFAFCSCLGAATVYLILARPLRSRYPRDRFPITSIPVSLEPPSRHTLQAVVTGALDAAARYIPPFAGLITIALCCSPLLAVAAEAFRQPSPSGMRWTLQNFQLMVSSDQLVDALVNSAGIAALVSFVAAIIGFVLSLVIWDRTLQGWVVLLLASLVLLPGDSYAISLVQILKVFGRAEGGWPLVVLAHVLWAIPFATGTLVLANRHLGEHVLEAALEYGNGPLEVIVRIIGAINLWRIAGVALLAGTLSLNEYVRSSYLGAALLTVSNEVHGRLTTGLLPQNRGVFAAEFLIFGVSVMSVIVTLALAQVSRLSAWGRIMGVRTLVLRSDT